MSPRPANDSRPPALRGAGVWWAIRHKPSGLFLPDLPRSHRAGATWLEPSGERPPRLFRSKAYAAAALRHWLEGARQDSWQEFGSLDNPSTERVTTRKKKPGRKSEEMELVQLWLFTEKAE